MSSTVELISLSMRLKTETRAEHEQTERHPFHAMLLKGKLPRPLYVSYLSQLLCIHRALASGLERLNEAQPSLQSVLSREAHQLDYLQSDLESLGAHQAAIVELPATHAFTHQISDRAVTAPLKLLGVHYVFEGSKNGGRYLARSIRQAFGLTGTDGTLYLDSYGDEQPMLWGQYKDVLDSVPLSAAQQETVVAGAKETFAALQTIATEILESSDSNCDPAATG